MLTNKPIVNKFYLYKTKLFKIKKIQKTANAIIIVSVVDNDEVVIPMTGADILLTRLYTIGELAKILDKRSDTIRKYEKNGLVPKPFIIDGLENSYKNWRFYREGDVYDMISFFSSRTPGRPVIKKDVNSSIKTLKQKVANL
jgi:hypothetical protein